MGSSAVTIGSDISDRLVAEIDGIGNSSGLETRSKVHISRAYDAFSEALESYGKSLDRLAPAMRGTKRIESNRMLVYPDTVKSPMDMIGYLLEETKKNPLLFKEDMPEEKPQESIATARHRSRRVYRPISLRAAAHASAAAIASVYAAFVTASSYAGMK